MQPFPNAFGAADPIMGGIRWRRDGKEPSTLARRHDGRANHAGAERQERRAGNAHRPFKPRIIPASADKAAERGSPLMAAV